jgi:Holliday junction DNA helicase RuvA
VIGRLRGLVAEVGEEDALIDVGGVGYVVRCGARTLGRLPALGEEVLIHVETQWSEATGTRLYGFLAREERQAFVMLQGVQGVGPKAALGVLDVLPPAELANAVAREDRAAIGRANGVGPKLAQRIVIELKGKPLSGPILSGGATPILPAPPSGPGGAVAALIGLGIPEVSARRVVDQAALRLGEDAGEAALIKAALRELGR